MNFRKYIMLLSLIVFSSASIAECDVNHPIYCQIINNKPKIDKEYAMRLSNVIFKLSKKYKVNPKIYTAIIAQESFYKLDSKNCSKGLTEDNIEMTICSDFGISQIHLNTVKRYNFEIEKLIGDLEYSVDAGMKVLKSFQIYKGKEDNWWSRYNSSSPTKRLQYEALVERFFEPKKL